MIKQCKYEYNGTVNYVYDGDSITVDLDLGFNLNFVKQKTRLYGIDAPELRGDTKVAGRASRDFLRQILYPGIEIIVETIKDKKGKYGRYLAKIWFENAEDEWICVNDLLVSEGHAVYREYLNIMFKSTGHLQYSQSGWLILKSCEDLASYYKSQLKVKRLGNPRGGSHITVINGDVESSNINLDLWGKHDSSLVEFTYSNQTRVVRPYYWLTIKCDRLLDIREELGLKRKLKYPLHLTLARDLDD